MLVREVVALEHENDNLPWLVFFQGGPGSGAPRPMGKSGWLGHALARLRVLLLDQQANGLSAADLAAIPIGEAFDKLLVVTGQTAEAATAVLYSVNNIGGMWYFAASLGLVTAFGLYVYGRWTYRLAR